MLLGTMLEQGSYVWFRGHISRRRPSTVLEGLVDVWDREKEVHHITMVTASSYIIHNYNITAI